MIYDGVVVDVNDPSENGDLKIYIPTFDGESYDIQNLPWAKYASPLAGFVKDYPSSNGTIQGNSAYGLWAIPKLGARVLVCFLNNDPNNRVYFASLFHKDSIKSLPAGRNNDLNNHGGPVGDSGDEKGNLTAYEPLYSNLRQQFQNKISESEAITRGMFEKAVSNGKSIRDGSDGYTKSPVDDYLESQTICLTSPGKHSIIMQDDPRISRFRIKSASGHQIILDDANERIYISTAQGNCYFEMDQDGRLHFFATESISFATGGDFNIFADGNINMESGKGINMKADSGAIKLHSSDSINLLSNASILLGGCSGIHLKSEDGLFLSSVQNIDISSKASIAIIGTSSTEVGGPGILKLGASPQLGATPRPAIEAKCPEQASNPSIVPQHEPWKRDSSKQTRNKYWRA